MVKCMPVSRSVHTMYIYIYICYIPISIFACKLRNFLLGPEKRTGHKLSPSVFFILLTPDLVENVETKKLQPKSYRFKTHPSLFQQIINFYLVSEIDGKCMFFCIELSKHCKLVTGSVSCQLSASWVSVIWNLSDLLSRHNLTLTSYSYIDNLTHNIELKFAVSALSEKEKSWEFHYYFFA